MCFALTQVPFADDSGLVVVALQNFGDIFQAIVEVGADGGNLVDVVVGAGEDGGAAGLAQRVGAKTIGKAHAALGDAVEVGGLVDATAVATHGVCGVVVGHDEEYIGTRHR